MKETPQPQPDKDTVTKICSKCGQEYTVDASSIANGGSICPSCFSLDFNLRDILDPKKKPGK